MTPSPKHVSCGVRTHAELPPVDLKSTPLPLGQTDACLVSHLFSSSVPALATTFAKPHWGLNPGPSVYKTDALPLSYRGLCRTGRLACVCNYDLRIHALVHLCRANAECPYPLCAVCWSQTCVVQERQLATMNDPVQVQSFPPVQANAICVLCEAMTCLTARPGPLFK